jgi:sec-independent protein translocase protein TatA
MPLGLENPLHILVLLVVLLLVFGAKRLPEMGRGLGRGLHEFKLSVTGQETEPVPPRDSPVGTPATTPIDAASE